MRLLLAAKHDARKLVPNVLLVLARLCILLIGVIGIPVKRLFVLKTRAVLPFRSVSSAVLLQCVRPGFGMLLLVRLRQRVLLWPVETKLGSYLVNRLRNVGILKRLTTFMEEMLTDIPLVCVPRLWIVLSMASVADLFLNEQVAMRRTLRLLS